MRAPVHPHASWASACASVRVGPALPPSEAHGRGEYVDASLRRARTRVGCRSILRRPCWRVAAQLRKRMTTDNRSSLGRIRSQRSNRGEFARAKVGGERSKSRAWWCTKEGEEGGGWKRDDAERTTRVIRQRSRPFPLINMRKRRST